MQHKKIKFFVCRLCSFYTMTKTENGYFASSFPIAIKNILPTFQSKKLKTSLDIKHFKIHYTTYEAYFRISCVLKSTFKFMSLVSEMLFYALYCVLSLYLFTFIYWHRLSLKFFPLCRKMQCQNCFLKITAITLF